MADGPTPPKGWLLTGVIFLVLSLAGCGAGERVDRSLADAFRLFGMTVNEATFGWVVLKVKISQIAAILPYLLLVLILIFRPRGLLGTREG